MRKTRASLATFLVLTLATAPARANPSLTTDMNNMSQWLSDQMAQGLAFNAGENFDPPKEIKGYYFQPDVSLGVGLIPFDKRTFPQMQVPQLQNGVGAALFPNSTLFPNFALHLRMGLPWRGDFYLRFADATIPPGYRISPTMTAQVQTNSYGAGIRQHLFGGDYPVLTLGAHYNHVQGYTKLKGAVDFSADGYNPGDTFSGDIAWSINSFGLTAILSQSYGRWTPFAGLGYNHATGSVSAALNLVSGTFTAQSIASEGSDRPEQNEGREIAGVAYERPTWSAFADGELKALGELEYRSWIVSAGVALPFDIGRSPLIFSRKRADEPVHTKPASDEEPEMPVAPSRRSPSPPPSPPQVPPEPTPSGMIFLR